MSTTAAPRIGSLRPALERSFPALLGVIVILAVGGVALGIGRSNLNAAEQDRLAKRIQSVNTLSGNVSDQASPKATAARVSTTPFNPAPGGINDTLIKQFQTSDDPAALAALVALDGTVLAATPAGSTIEPAVFGPLWDRAAAGEAVTGDTLRYRGVLTTSTLVPVGSPTPYAVAVVLKPALGSADQAFMEQVGSMNGRPGGLAVLDRKGSVYTSWSPELIGQSMLTPDEVAALPADGARLWTRTVDGEEWTTIARKVGDGFGFIFEQRTEDLFYDLRNAQHGRDVTLLAVLAAALAALVIFQLSRELAARKAEARVHTLLKNSQDLVLSADPDGGLSFVSPAIESLLGIPPEAWTGQNITTMSHPEDQARLAWLLEHPESGPLLNVRFAGEDGEDRYFDIEARDLRSHPEVGGVLLTCHEIGQRKELQDELNHQATHDRLTGLPNRAELSDRLEALLRNGRPTRPFALLYLDLDHFKPVNDTMGHDAGDEVLVTVSARLREAAGPRAFVSRLGGDEFAVLLDGAGHDEAVAAAETLRDAARLPIAIGSRLAHLDASIGIALTDPGTHLANAEQVVRWADQAMYQSKRGGRGRWSIAVPSVTEADVAAARAGADIERHTQGGHTESAAAPLSVPTAETESFERRPRRRLAGALPIAVAVGLVIGIAGFGLHQSTERQQASEADYLAQQSAFGGRAAGFYSSVNDSGPLTKVASNAPWTLDGSPVDAAVAKAFATSPTAGKDAVAVLATVDGRKLASYPANASLSIAPSEKIWQEAVGLGQGNQIPGVEDPDQTRGYFVLPVRRDGRTVAVLALGLSARYGPMQVALEKAGSAGFSTGGWSQIDADGVVLMSWNPALIGTRLIDRDRLAGLPPGRTLDVSDDEQILMVSPMTSSIEPVYLAFAMPTADFMRDLRIGQFQSDLAFVGLLAAAVIGLALVNQRRERAMRRSEARLDALLQQAHDVVIVLDAEGRATFISSAVQRLLGYAPAEHVGQPLRALIHNEDRDRVLAMLAEVHARGAGAATDVRVIGDDGIYHWFDAHAVDLTSHPEVGGVVVTCHEVTERRQLQEQLAHRAAHDALTGLPNRAMLAKELAELSSADPTAPFAVLFVDLDHFKPVNDTLGHSAGDEVLRVVAERFAQSVRVDGGDLVCRLGGDEFAIVLRNTTEPVARVTAERLLEAARLPIQVGGDTVRISATIGISQSHPDRQSPDTTVRYADLAMYQAKEAGRGGYAVFQPGDDDARGSVSTSN